MVHHPCVRIIAVIAAAAAAARVGANADYFEGFENAGTVNGGEHGPSGLIAAGWQFRNQSDPVWFGDWSRDAYAYQGGWALHVDFSVSHWENPSSEASSWALLPPLAGQVAGDEIRFFFRSTEIPDLPGNGFLEIRYSASGGTDTGSGSDDVGDFDTLLASLPHGLHEWQEFTVPVPGGGRIALRFHIPPVPEQLDFWGDYAIDNLSVGPPFTQPAPIPGPGETVHWTAEMSPIAFAENVTIPAGGTVIVDPGVRIDVAAGTTVFVEGTLRTAGTEEEPVTVTHPSVFPPALEIEGGTFEATFTDFGGQVLVRSGASVALGDCTFAGNGLLRSSEIPAAEAFLVLERCQFTSSQLSLSDAIVILRDNTFDDTHASLLRGYPVVLAENTFTGRPLEIIRESSRQPLPVDGVHAQGMTGAPGLRLAGGNFQLRPGNVLLNSLYPLEVDGGLTPDSVVPLAGNTNNAISVGSGATSGLARWPDLGLPYRLTETFVPGGAPLTIDPGVTVEAVASGAGLYLGNGRRLLANGRPDAPIIFRSLGPDWQGLVFHLNGDTGSYLQHCEIRDADFGLIATDSLMYADHCLFAGNLVGANANTFGSAYLSGCHFTGNATAVSIAGTGTVHLADAATPNSIAGNTIGVNAFDSQSDADARFVWWGDASGPQHPSNPGGQGDPIVGVGASGILFTPYLTEEPAPPAPHTVRLVEPGFAWSLSPDFFFEPGERYVIRWELDDAEAVTSQRIEFSPFYPTPDHFQVVASDLPADLRSYEWTVNAPGFDNTFSSQFLRVVAVDTQGREAMAQVPIRVSAGEITGSLTITTDLSGQVFHAGEEIPDVQWTGAVSGANTVTPFILLENDGSVIGGLNAGGNQGYFFESFPHVTTDRARLALRAGANSNRVRWFFADGYFSIRHDPRLELEPPSIALTSPAPGQAFPGGATIPITWTATAPEGLRSFDVQASYNGGQTWHLVARDLPATATSFDWPLPATGGIPDVRVRVIVRDERFQNAADDAPIAILPGPLDVPGDVNGDGVVDVTDLVELIVAWGPCPEPPALCAADLDGDGIVSVIDLVLVIVNWS